MLLASLPPDHQIRIRCEKCGKSGAFKVAELTAELGSDLTLDAIRRRFESRRCCGQPIKVETGVQ